MVGIIAEYNPFHNGHVYHLRKVKEMFPNEVIALVLAGPFLNRGDVSVINKWDKTELALKYGVDIVVELPFVFATQAADYYALGAIKILDYLKADYLVFGSECADIDLLTKTANTKVDNDVLKNNIKKGNNYPKSLAIAINSNIDTPNDLLGISYIKAINKLNSQIKPITIKRTNSYHSLDSNDNIISASAIRNLLNNNQDISSFVPKEVIPLIKNIKLDDYFDILKHQIIIDTIQNYYGVDIKLANRLKKVIMDCTSLDELISKVKTKNFSYNTIKRALVHILCGLKQNSYDINYIRLLGFSNKGKTYLNKIKKELSVPIITNYCDDLKIEMQATKIYSLLTNVDIVDLELNKPKTS